MISPLPGSDSALRVYNNWKHFHQPVWTSSVWDFPVGVGSMLERVSGCLAGDSSSFTCLSPAGHRGCYRWQCLPAQQGEPVDNKRGGANPEPADKAGEALQVHRDLCDYAKEWCWATHSKFLLLGQLQ